MFNHEHKILENNDQKEALFNEYKGNLFEFLVCERIAHLFSISKNFHEGLTHKLLEKLKEYQESLFHYDEKLYEKIYILAETFSREIYPNILKSLNGSKINSVVLLGKLQAISGERLWSEADLLLKTDSGEIPVSLKLSKKGAYTNTKSAGMRSFYTTYFSSFRHVLGAEKLEEMQRNFNQIVDDSFNQMGFKLYEEKGMVFKGEFDQDWSRLYTELPGMLEKSEHEILMNHYKRISDHLMVELKKLYELNPKFFLESLLTLMGMQNQSSWQWICFHEQHEYSSTSFKDTYKVWQKLANEKIEFSENKESFGAIHLGLEKYQIQLRIKPMNKFTTRSYKINCSYKLGAR